MRTTYDLNNAIHTIVALVSSTRKKYFSTKYISVFLNTRKADLNTLAEFN